jgi:ribosome biogenesis protein BMS1
MPTVLPCGAVPVMDRASQEPPPFTVLVHGPPGVGKSTLIRNLVKHYTRHSLSEIKGPITVVSGKTRRLTFVECPQVRLQALRL